MKTCPDYLIELSEENWLNIQSSYGRDTDLFLHAEGYLLIGGTLDLEGREVHLFLRPNREKALISNLIG